MRERERERVRENCDCTTEFFFFVSIPHHSLYSSPATYLEVAVYV
jgi:hypothetical protein